MAEIPTPYEPHHLQSVETRIEVDARALELMLRQCGSLPEFWHTCTRVDWLLHVLAEASQEPDIVGEDVRPALRRFACWSAVEAGADPEDPLMVYATAMAGGRKPSRALVERRLERQKWLAVVGTEGMPRCIPVAAAALAAWYAGDEDIFAGARWTADFAIKATVFSEAEAWAAHWNDPDEDGEEWFIQWHTSAWLTAHPGVANRIRETTEKRLARGLREVIRNPFPVPGVSSAAR